MCARMLVEASGVLAARKKLGEVRECGTKEREREREEKKSFGVVMALFIRRLSEGKIQSEHFIRCPFTEQLGGEKNLSILIDRL